MGGFRQIINAIDDGELTAYAHYLLIRPEYQNMKIGSNLIAKLKKVYEGYLYLILTAENEKLLPFYQNMGFKLVAGAYPMVFQTL